jgi:hypothetical protein
MWRHKETTLTATIQECTISGFAGQQQYQGGVYAVKNTLQQAMDCVET